MKRRSLVLAAGMLAAALGGAGIALAAFAPPSIITLLTSTQLFRIYGTPGSVTGYVQAPQIVSGAVTPSTSGTNTQTFTNSPCTVSTSTGDWLPVTITGQSGTWYVPACH